MVTPIATAIAPTATVERRAVVHACRIIAASSWTS
jgi:hypothetical protein